jgi:hypothetical protein
MDLPHIEWSNSYTKISVLMYISANAASPVAFIPYDVIALTIRDTSHCAIF